VLVSVALVVGPRPLLTVVLIALAALGAFEMYSLLSRRGADLPLIPGIVLTVLLVLAAADEGTRLLGLVVFLTFAVPLVWVLRGTPDVAAVQTWAGASVGVFYVGWPLAHIALLRFLPEGRSWLILVFACTWASDTGAYLVGSVVGRRKLAPSISPGKTVEGALGAVAVTAATAGGVQSLTDLPIALPWAVLLGVVMSVAAQLGDLSESYLKRAVGAKDSGHLLPGHGGLLDRIDGLMWVTVVVYYVAVFVG